MENVQVVKRTFKDAQERNNLKYAILGGNISRILNCSKNNQTDKEITIIKQIKFLQNELLKDFDQNSKLLGFRIERYKVIYDENLRFDVKELYKIEDLKRHRELIKLENIKFKKVIL